MKQKRICRIGCLLLSLLLALSLTEGFAASAAEEIWTEAPTGWHNRGHVYARTRDGLTLNWGVRGEDCGFLTERAYAFYPDLYDGQGMGGGYDMIGTYAGGTGPSDAPQSPLYQQLRSLLRQKHTHLTDEAEVRALLRDTDCMVSDANHIASFFSGRKLNAAWDGGKTWKVASVWPADKASGGQNEDIIALRPISVQEDAARGSTAYGVSQGYYNPNQDAAGNIDVRGDTARILLYCYVRWDNQDHMWGKDGVIESVDVLLDWIRQDPVDTWEMGRNEAVESITGCRNPFVDYPELAWALFGRELPSAEEFRTPFRRDHDDFVSVPALFEAVSSNEAWGKVRTLGWAAIPTPAAGYYVAGYTAEDSSPYIEYPDGSTAPYMDGMLEWQHGRLLYFPPTEHDAVIEIQFQPIGKPASATVALGKTATFQISAKGADLRYQWQYQRYGETVWHDWVGRTARTLTVTGSKTNNGCKYRCLVINEAGSFPSLPATLTVSGAPLPPTVKTQPAAVKAKLGTEVSFTVKASGDALSYQWQYSKDNGAHWNLWSGKTEPTLRVKASRTNNGCLYRCEIKNSTGAIRSAVARLTVTDIQPSIVGQPKDFSAPLGKTFTLKVVAAGSGLSYQWQYKKVGDTAWHNWSGKTSYKLEITGSRTNDNCLYRCVVKNSYGTVTSASARLAVR